MLTLCRFAAAAQLLALLLAAALQQAAAEYSQLWGMNGGRWTPSSRIVDHSYAGYGAGARALPAYNLTFNVKNYGAKGDNLTDDSEAFLRAIRAASLAAFNLTSVPCRGRRIPRRADSLFLAQAPQGRCPTPHLGFGNLGRAGATVFIPPGTYRITKMLELTQSNVVVKGAGQNKTVLHFPTGLKRLYGDQMEWQWSGGFLVVVGPEINSTHTGYQLGAITADVVKGQRRLAVSSTTGVAVGQWVRLWARSPLGTRRRRSVLEPAEHARAAAAARAARTGRGAAPRTGSRRLQAGAGGFLPLSPAMEEAWRQAQGLGLGRPEYPGLHAGQVGIASANGTLDAYIYGGNMVDSGSEPFPLERIRFVSRVARKGPNWIELERPLPYDLRLEWEPAVYSFEQAVQHSGWEGFTVEFAWTPYPSHFVVEGMNGFWLSGAANCWVRNVDIVNADSGAEAINSDFVTMSNIKLWHTAPRGGKTVHKGMNGHHGLWAAHSSNVLISQIIFDTMFIHDLTMDVWAEECVFKNSKGLDMNTDMHRGGSHNNLWTNLDLGKGRRAFASSGAGIRGAHAAANNTWWNIQSSRGTINIPECGFGPSIIFVGPEFSYPDNQAAGVSSMVAAPANSTVGIKNYCPQNRWYTEVVPNLAPLDLHAAMRATRQARIGGP